MKELIGKCNKTLATGKLSFGLEQKFRFKKILGCLSTIILLTLIGSQATQTFAQTCSTAPANLVSWYRGENNALDTKGNNNGILQNGATFANGYVNQAFSFDGVDDRVMIPASASLDVGTSNGFTIVTWINPNDINGTDPIAEWNNGASLGSHFFINEFANGGGAGSLFANLVDTSGASHLFSSPGGLFTAGQWNHVALTYDKTSGNAFLYLNGAVVGQSNLGTFTPQTTYDLYLGARIASPFGTNFLNGKLDEVSLYNRALSTTEIQTIVTADTAGKCLSPTAANVAISGRVTNNGRGLPRVLVTLKNGQGHISYAQTNAFGYFRFQNIEAGQTYVAEANSKQYVFSPQVINVTDDLTNLNFSPITKLNHQDSKSSDLNKNRLD